MSPPRLYYDYLQDIVDHCDKAMRFAGGLTFDDFAEQEEKVFAVVRALEVIGEAARHIPKSLQAKYPHVPWRQISGMRNKITHEYFAVDVEVVWKTVREDLPRLRAAVKQMLDDLARSSGH